jgi:hypothetical protein
MKSHSSKASRKSFDVTKMSGPEIAAEMSRQMTEFKSARKHWDPAISRQESAPAEPHSKQAGNHHFLRASLAAGAGSAVSPSSLRDRDLQPDEPSGPQSGGPGLAFLRRGARNERSAIIAERRAPQYPREWSYREGLLAGASLVLLLIGIGSAALWQSGALPEFIERSLQATLRSPTETRSEPAPRPIPSPEVAAATSLTAVDQAPPPPPAPIILMVTPAPTISNPTLTVDTLSAITVLQPDAPAIDIVEGNLQPLLADDEDGTETATPLGVETAAGPSAAPPAAGSTLEILKHLAERPSLKPALDVEGPAEPPTTSTVPIGIGATTDAQPEAPFVATAKPFVPQGTSSPLGQKAANAAPDSETSALEQLPAQTLSPLPPPIVIRSTGHVSDAPGAASVVISEKPPADDQRAASNPDNPNWQGRRDPNSETDAQGGDGPNLADIRPDRPSASGRGHGSSPSGGVGGGGSSSSGTDPGDGTGGSGGTDGSGGSAGGSTDGDGGTGGSDGGTGGDSDGGDGGSDGGSAGGSDGGAGGDGGSDGGSAGGSDGGAGGDGGSDGGGGESDGSDGGSDGGGGGSDGGSAGGSDGGAGGDGGSDGGGGESDGGDGGSDGDGGDGGGDTSGGDGGSSGGENDGSSDGGDDGSAGGGGLGGALGGLGGALGGALGGN